jgi:hypothetical protein
MRNYVYCLSTGTWEKYDIVSPLAVDNLRGSALEDNKQIMVTGGYDIVTYPNEGKTGELATIKTKRLSVTTKTGAVIPIRMKKIRVVYKGKETAEAKLKVFNDRMTDGYKEVTLNLKESGRWTGMPLGLKGLAFEIEFNNVEMIQEIEVSAILITKEIPQEE